MFDVRKATPLPARWCCALLALPLGCAAADGYTFDPALLRGSVLSNSALSQFNQQDAVAPAAIRSICTSTASFSSATKFASCAQASRCCPVSIGRS